MARSPVTLLHVLPFSRACRPRNSGVYWCSLLSSCEALASLDMDSNDQSLDLGGLRQNDISAPLGYISVPSGLLSYLSLPVVLRCQGEILLEGAAEGSGAGVVQQVGDLLD